jgi:hypothetical protein
MEIKTIKEGRRLCRQVRELLYLKVNSKMYLDYSQSLREYSVTELQYVDEYECSLWFTTMRTTSQEELARWLVGKEAK